MFRHLHCFSPVWRKKNNNGMFGGNIEEISDSDSQLSFSNEESSSIHVSSTVILNNLSSSLLKLLNDYFQDTNEVEADNTDKESDFNLKVYFSSVTVTFSHNGKLLF